MSKTAFIGRRSVVRTYSAGVHIGTVESIEGKEVVLKESRRLWYWKGAFTLSEVASAGIDSANSKVSAPVAETLLTEAIEIIPITDAAAATVDAAPNYDPK